MAISDEEMLAYLIPLCGGLKASALVTERYNIEKNSQHAQWAWGPSQTPCILVIPGIRAPPQLRVLKPHRDYRGWREWFTCTYYNPGVPWEVPVQLTWWPTELIEGTGAYPILPST